MCRAYQLWILCALLGLLHVQTISGDDNKRKREKDQPHIIFIMADDLGYNDVGYHESTIQTPHIDKLAKTGVRLENYYVQPVCTASRSQLLLGKYQIHTGLQHSIIWPSQPNAMPKEPPTLAEKLREQGYATHIVGKWHLGFYKEEYLPTNRGFDTFYGFRSGSQDHFTHIGCYGEECGYDFWNGTEVLSTSQYSTHLYTGRVEHLIQNHCLSGNKQPMFLYLSFQAPHGPLQVPEQYLEKYQNVTDENRRNYSGMVTCLDEAIRNITQTLKLFDLYDNSVIIFSTDNGGQPERGGSNFPLRGWKGSLWEGGVRAAGFVHSPLLTHPEPVNSELIHISDWFPTLYRLAGGDESELNVDGFNQWKTLSIGQESPRKEILMNIDPLVTRKGEQTSRDFDNRVKSAIRVTKWKLLTGSPGNGSWVLPPEMNGNDILDTSREDQNIWLFNIEEDPLEVHDLSLQHPHMVTLMLERLAFYNRTAVPVVYPEKEEESFPRFHRGLWQPWH